MPRDPTDFSDVRSGATSTPAASTGTRTADFSDVRTGSSSVPTGATGARTYTVKPGDTLSGIAKQMYGKAGGWDAIFQANRDQLDDADKIQPGQVLKIPA